MLPGNEQPDAPSSPKDDKKPRLRSPNYPGIGLREAVAKLKAIYSKDRLTPSFKEAAVQHMGFQRQHGEAGRVVAALKSFGLVEEEEGRLKFTQIGKDIAVRDESDQKRIAALQSAVTLPGIYRELMRDYKEQGTLPSDTSLRSELIAVKGFNPNAVDGFIRDLRDSLDFSGLSDFSVVDLGQGADESSDTEEEAPTTVGKMFVKELERGRVPGEALRKVGEKMLNAPILTQTLVISIPRDFKVDIGVRGDELKKEDLAKIKSQFNRWIEGLEEAFEE